MTRMLSGGDAAHHGLPPICECLCEFNCWWRCHCTKYNEQCSSLGSLPFCPSLLPFTTINTTAPWLEHASCSATGSIANAGYEGTNAYEGCILEFCEIANIHVVTIQSLSLAHMLSLLCSLRACLRAGCGGQGTSCTPAPPRCCW